jgi:hypothetical protein
VLRWHRRRRARTFHGSDRITPPTSPGPDVLDEFSRDPKELLRELGAATGPVPARWTDPGFGARLRELVRAGWAREVNGFVHITSAGRRALAGAPDPEREPATERPRPVLAALPPDLDVNPTQEELLRRIVRAEGRASRDELDGRVVRALEGRGLVASADGWVELTDAGRAYCRRRFPSRRRAGAAPEPRAPRPAGPRSPAAADPAEGERRRRVAAIRESVATLRSLVEDGATIRIEELEAPARDTFEALLELADRIERQADPRRISRR